MKKKKKVREEDNWYKKMKGQPHTAFACEVADGFLRIIAVIILGFAVLAILDGLGQL